MIKNKIFTMCKTIARTSVAVRCYAKKNFDFEKTEFDTRLIHARQIIEPYSGAVNIPIYQSSTFSQESVGEFYPAGCDYTRAGNPTRANLEGLIASLENGKYCHVASSGLGAITNIITIMKEGDHVVSSDDLYGGTRELFVKIFQEMGVEFTFVDFNDEAEFQNSFKENTKLVWGETPTNPLLSLFDIEKISSMSHSYNEDIIVAIDNTFMSPYFQNPLDLGADIVMHSCTKYINGHSDVVLGATITNSEELNDLLYFRNKRMGSSASPFDCFLCIRGLKTLSLRMEKHQENAIAIAEYLESHPKVYRVLYPGLESHPHHYIAKKQMSGYGGMITIFLKGGLEESKKFLENLNVFILAESLGGVESLAESPSNMTHASIPKEVRVKLGLNDSLVRLSVGIENSKDLIEDLEYSLSLL